MSVCERSAGTALVVPPRADSAASQLTQMRKMAQCIVADWHKAGTLTVDGPMSKAFASVGVLLPPDGAEVGNEYTLYAFLYMHDMLNHQMLRCLGAGTTCGRSGDAHRKAAQRALSTVVLYSMVLWSDVTTLAPMLRSPESPVPPSRYVS